LLFTVLEGLTLNKEVTTQTARYQNSTVTIFLRFGSGEALEVELSSDSSNICGARGIEADDNEWVSCDIVALASCLN
jgi:hypothetical protein